MQEEIDVECAIAPAPLNPAGVPLYSKRPVTTAFTKTCQVLILLVGGLSRPNEVYEKQFEFGEC
jgi:hypothetical protein